MTECEVTQWLDECAKRVAAEMPDDFPSFTLTHPMQDAAMTKYALTNNVAPVPLGGKGFVIGVSTEAPWTVMVEFDGFQDEDEARAYAHRLNDSEIFVSTKPPTPN